jgi:hypothetical protein
MPFKVLFDGQPFSALTCDDAAWRDVQAASRSDEARLTLPCCLRRAFAKVSPRRTRFFQHAPRAVAGVDCPWEGETEAHREIKKAIVNAVNAMEGWAAEEEFIAANWRADVMATHGGPGVPPVAFEVQLARQSGEETRRRDALYETGGVVAVWLVNQHNDRPSFGSDRRLALRPEALGLRARCEAAAKAACSYLRRVEWQTKAVRAAAEECTRHGGIRALLADGAMRVGVDAPGLGRRGGVRIAFLMAGLGERDAGLPGQHAKTPDDEPLPLYVHWAGKQGYREVHRYAIAVHETEPEPVARELVNDLATGRIAYVPSFTLPASLVHYRETCRACMREFNVCRWALVGGGAGHPAQVPEWFGDRLPFVVAADDLGWPNGWEKNAWNSAAQRLGGYGSIHPAWEIGAARACPYCLHGTLPPHRITKADALAWPAEYQDGWWSPSRVSVSVWSRMVPAAAAPPVEVRQARWQTVFAERSAAAHAEIAGLRTAREAADRQRREDMARLEEERARARAEEARKRAEAEETARRQREEERARLAAEREAEERAKALAAAEARLRTAEGYAAAVHPGRSDLAALWLNSSRRGGSLRDLARASQEGLRLVEEQAKRDRGRR